jgi:hypothetical protein
MKTMSLSPGDKVRITQHAFRNEDITATVVATEGSIGTVLSYDELVGYVDEGSKKDDDLTFFVGGRPTPVKQLLDKGEAYPIRFETVVPPSKDFCSYWEKATGRFFVECEVGEIKMLHVMFLEKVT